MGRPLKITPTQNLFLKALYDKILATKTTTIREKLITPLSLDIVKTNTVYPFIPPTIQSWILDHSGQTVYKKIELQIAHRQVVIHLFGFSRYSENKYMKMVHIMKSWLEIVSLYASKTCAAKLEIYLYLTPFRKELGEYNGLPDEMQINTASTTSCMTANSILIYRREEWFKVFIHETFHCLGLDFSDQNTETVDRNILALYSGCDPSLDVRFYETYCEIWATVINILFVMAYTKATPATRILYERSREKTRKYSTRNMAKNRWNLQQFLVSLDKERKYTMKQVGKILHYHSITYRQLIGLEEIETPYREKTQIFSYYVLKSVLFFYMEDFWKWVEEVSHFSLDFPKKNVEESMEKFYKIIERNYNRQDFIEELEEAKTNSHSMKMTVYGDFLSK